ncbi:unnamed protein product [Ambrosiozyma monospora]|uniref:Unnamed protein product n=1 Tax=Ambrosiozyma monospora TaxID=43982 RepID=A0ACB5T3S1_AMBMO|nr:unnamed protein product [Ambrosiozyma monospora]
MYSSKISKKKKTKNNQDGAAPMIEPVVPDEEERHEMVIMLNRVVIRMRIRVGLNARNMIEPGFQTISIVLFPFFGNESIFNLILGDFLTHLRQLDGSAEPDLEID